MVSPGILQKFQEEYQSSIVKAQASWSDEQQGFVFPDARPAEILNDVFSVWVTSYERAVTDAIQTFEEAIDERFKSSPLRQSETLTHLIWAKTKLKQLSPHLQVGDGD